MCSRRKVHTNDAEDFGEKIMSWIRVEEKSPDHDGFYLVYLDQPHLDGRIRVCRFSKSMKSDKKIWRLGISRIKVSHWRHLPDPPEATCSDSCSF